MKGDTVKQTRLRKCLAVSTGLFESIWNHLSNWAEVYLWVPVSLVGIFAAAELSYFLTGRRPTENADWLVDYSAKAVQMVAIIALTSIAKEALGMWMNKEEKLTNPYAYMVNSASTIILFIVVAYVFLH
jgi:hypothetical protein